MYVAMAAILCGSSVSSSTSILYRNLILRSSMIGTYSHTHRTCRQWSTLIRTVLPNADVWQKQIFPNHCLITMLSGRFQPRKACVQHARNFHVGKTWQATRWKGGKLPFEVETNVLKDTVLFSYSDDRFYKMISIFGIVQFIFWSNIALFTYNGLDAVRTQKGPKQLDTDSWWGKILLMQAEYKHHVTAGCVIVGYMIMFFTWFYPKRCISQLKLLRGGQSVLVQTYTHFGRKHAFTVPLDHLNCKQSRFAKTSQISLKIKDSWFYYLLDNRSGRFHNADLFDQTVGLKRTF